MTRAFGSLSTAEVLALAVHIERANADRFRAFADVFQGYDDTVSARFEEQAREEEEHEALLRARFRDTFGENVPALHEEDVEGVIESVDIDDAEHLIFDSLQQEHVYELAEQAEQRAQQFYERATACAQDPGLAALYRELAEMESGHSAWIAEKLQALHAERKKP